MPRKIELSQGCELSTFFLALRCPFTSQKTLFDVFLQFVQGSPIYDAIFTGLMYFWLSIHFQCIFDQTWFLDVFLIKHRFSIFSGSREQESQGFLENFSLGASEIKCAQI